MIIIGDKFSRLIVMKMVEDGGTSDTRLFLCKCICGNRLIVKESDLLSRKIKSCGCLEEYRDEKEVKKEKYEKLIGTKPYGLTIIGYDEKLSEEKGKPMLIVKCDCGAIEKKDTNSVLSGRAKTCIHCAKDGINSCKFYDKSGEIYGRYKIISFYNKESYRNQSNWVCEDLILHKECIKSDNALRISEKRATDINSFKTDSPDIYKPFIHVTNIKTK